MRLRLVAIVMAALCTFTASPTFASWPANSTANLAVSTAAEGQLQPASVSDGAGGVILVWTDLRNGNYDLFAQHVDALGRARWAANGIPVCVAPGAQDLAAIASDGAGGAVIAWEDLRSGQFDVYAQRIDASGTALWAANGAAVCTATNEQSYPAILADGAGGTIIAWEDYRSGSADVYAQRLTASGAAQWAANGVALCTAAGDQNAPVLTTDAAGGALCVWQDARTGVYDLYARHVTATGVVQWGTNGVPVCTAAGDQLSPSIVADGTGGLIATWFDGRVPSYDIYAQKLNASGAAQWIANGRQVCDTTLAQQRPLAVTDGAGGAIIVWEDGRAGLSDLYAQRISAAGSNLWQDDGIPVCVAPGAQQLASVAADGAGGVVVAWQDARLGGNVDVYGQRLNGAGVARWTANGQAVCSAPGAQTYPVVAPDATGGGIIAWQDLRAGVWTDIYSQRVEGSGLMGSVEPVITCVCDVPADEGGRVTIDWTASPQDGPGAVAVYQVYKRSGTTWNLLDARIATGSPSASYSVTDFSAPLSFPGVTAQASYRVDALAANDALLWSSLPDSGTSTDNLPPARPEGLLPSRTGDVNRITWDGNREPDFRRYHLHRGTWIGFEPDASTFVQFMTDTVFTESIGPNYWYRIAAEDTHGNLSPYNYVQPGSPVGTPGPQVPSVAFLGAPAPNPSRAGVGFRFGLPSSGRVTLAMHDSQGRRVRELASGTFAAGTHAARWDGRDDGGHPVAPGIYWARLSLSNRLLVQRVTLVR